MLVPSVTTASEVPSAAGSPAASACTCCGCVIEDDSSYDEYDEYELDMNDEATQTLSTLPMDDLIRLRWRIDGLISHRLRLVGIEPNPGPKRRGKASGAVAGGAASQTRTATRSARTSSRKEPKQHSKGGSLMRDVGGFLGGMFGPSGESLGRKAGGWLSKLVGMGSYKIQRNCFAQCSGDDLPQFGNVGEGHVITHREYIQDIAGSTDFSVQSFPINVGLNGTFPWLSALGTNYEQYDFLGLVFEYKSTSGFAVSSTNSALGTVIMATNYDSLDANFSSKQQMDAYEYRTPCAPYENALHGIECQPGLNVLSNLYIRNGSPPANSDQRLYDLGNFQIATVGMPSTVTTIGELWVTYKVRLLKPKLPTPLGAGLIGAHITEYPTGSATAAAPLGTTGGFPNPGSLLPVQTESTAFTLPYAGQWLVTCFWGTAAADIAANPTVTPGSNVTLLSLIADHGSISVANHVSTSAFLSFVCSVSASAAAASNQIAIGGLTSMTAATCDIFVQQTSGALTDIVETKKHASLLDELVNQVCIRMKGEVPDSRPLFENRPPNTPLHFSEREMTDVSLLETLKGISARLGAR